jgi:filamentous hemagglutinin family protein
MRPSSRKWALQAPAFGLSLLPLLTIAIEGHAAALPTGGQVVAGAAQISSANGPALTINQSSSRAIIDWTGFSIGSGGSVQFNNGAGATLNRVTGASVSSIDGRLSATGSVFLINPNGVIVGKGGVVRVGGGFVASTLDVSNAAFLAGGDLTFTGASTASVVNLGKIGALGGDVALIAGAVENDGAITAATGDVGLLAGQSVLVRDLAVDDGKFAVLTGGASTSATNTGGIAAAQVELRAEGGNVYALAGNTGGVIRATGVTAIGGKVFLVADGGDVTVNGAVHAQTAAGAGGAIDIAANLVSNNGVLDASGAAGGTVSISGRSLINNGQVDVQGLTSAGGRYTADLSRTYLETQGGVIQADGATTGGTIQVQAGLSLFTSGAWSANGSHGAGGSITGLAGAVTLADADVSATGMTGGAIRIGGDFHGASDLISATTTAVTAGSTLDASGAGAAGGGSLVVWSDSQTSFFGAAKALGAGRIEISSGGGLAMGGLANAGVGGQVLFDPKNIVIDATAGAYAQYQLIDPDPSSGDGFGGAVTKLSNGNYVVVAMNDSLAATSSGAVYLFNGSTGALISTLTGSQANDQVGSNGITALANGNFVVDSPFWANGTAFSAGAVTWGSGTTGVAGAVSISNSLTGSQSGDLVGMNGVGALPNGNYVVLSPIWAKGTASGAGAITWGSGTTGVDGAVSLLNSLTGSHAGDEVGSGVVTLLSNGNFVVDSPYWANGSAAAAGAVTWVNASTGGKGAISATNSLVGSQSGDSVGSGGVTALTNGAYVVDSPQWANGTVTTAGAVTWSNATGTTVGVISATNSLVGSQAGDMVGMGGVTALTNGNYVVASPDWANGAATTAGAATWGSGTTGVVGAISSTNSLVGSQTGDMVGNQIIALTNGNYVVSSPYWANGATTQVGAATWGSGAAGVDGAITSGNSLIGSTAGDMVSAGGVFALTNGNYVVASPLWSNGSVTAAGAATWGSGASGVVGTVSSTNSLVGSQASDEVSLGGVTALTNGNYVISSPQWANGSVAGAGAATWGSGTSGVVGAISSTNSLVGSQAGDSVSVRSITALTNGDYVVASPDWANGTLTTAGAVTWGNGTTGVVGAISATNSLVGTHAGDTVGDDGVVALTNGNYVAVSEAWSSNLGAVTWGSGTAGVVGAVSSSNSLVGSHANDLIGSGGVVALSDGDYVVNSIAWANGSNAGAGAITLGDGVHGTSGPITASNSLVGTQASENLQWVMDPTDSNTLAAVSQATNQVFIGLKDLNQLTFGAAQTQTVTITPTELAAELATGSSVTLAADDDITINSALSVAGTSNGGALTLDAGRSILINASINTNNGALTLLANAPLSAGVVDAQRDTGAAVITMAAGTSINTGTAAVSITMGNGAGRTNTAAGLIDLGSITAASIDVENHGGVAGSDLTVDGTLASTAAAGVTLSAFGNVTLDSASAITAAGGAPVSLRADNTAAGTGMVNVASAGQITTSGAVSIFYDPTSNPAGSTINATSYTSPKSFSGLVAGGGSLTAYMLVNTVYDLQNIENNLSGVYALGANIDATATAGWNGGAGFAPIGSAAQSFQGDLFGNSYSITGLTIDRPAGSAIGLFSQIAAAGLVSGVTLIQVNITGSTAVGALAGYNDGTITSSGVVAGSVSGSNAAGGLVGYNLGTISSSSGSVVVSGTGAGYAIGGVVGTNTPSGTLSGDTSASLVSGGLTWSGGLVGVNSGLVTGAFSSATISGSVGVGGLAGYSEGTITLSGSGSGAVSGANSVGGLVGYDTGAISHSSNTDSVTGTGVSYAIGGLTGTSTASASLSSDTSSGSISSTGTWSAGLVAVNAGAIANSFSNATVVGNVGAGGLVGNNGGTIIASSVASGSVSGANSVGGLVGYNTGAINNSTSADPVTGTGVSYAIAGVAGTSTASATLSNDHASGAINGSGYWAAGLVAVNAGTIATSFSNATVVGNIGAGGLVGDNSGAITGSSVASGAVSGANSAGGLVGYNTGAITNSTNADPVSGTGVSYAIAGIAGTNTAGATISNDINTSAGVVTSTGTWSGGLAAVNAGSISGSASNAAVSGNIGVGGLVGSNSGALGSSTVAAVTVSGANSVGGLVGYNTGAISGLTSPASVVGNGVGYGVGGFAGTNTATGTLSNDSASGSVSGGLSWTGGLVGLNYGSISGSSASGSVGGAFGVGGLAGYNSGTIGQAFSTGAVTGSSTNVGGLVGENIATGSITNVYATGSASGLAHVGGLIGANLGAFSMGYSVGAVSGTAIVGGTVGFNLSGAVVQDVYWDVSTSGQTASVGTNAGTLTSVLGVGGATGRNPNSASSYQGFDFTNVWAISGGSSRPYLKNVSGSAPPP